MVHMHWISALGHPSLLDALANSRDAASLSHELRMGSNSEFGARARSWHIQLEVAKLELYVY